jgi:hypothetical protein
MSAGRSCRSSSWRLLWLRDDRLAPALALGPALYTVYTVVTAILGQDYARFPGNVERAFPFPQNHPVMASLVGVPIRFSREVLGPLYARALLPRCRDRP